MITKKESTIKSKRPTFKVIIAGGRDFDDYNMLKTHCDKILSNKRNNGFRIIIVSGTATQITANQIKKLEQSDDYEDVNFIALEANEILGGVTETLVDRIVLNLISGVTVCVHTSDLIANFDGFSEDSFNAELTKDKFAGMITDFLAELTKQVTDRIGVVLITLGGETSYKCCKVINSNELRLIDEVVPAISICADINHKWIITKSGNLGNSNTLIEILNYLKRHE